MTGLIEDHGAGWTVDQPRNRPAVHPDLMATLRNEAPIDPVAAELYEAAITPEGHR